MCFLPPQGLPELELMPLFLIVFKWFFPLWTCPAAFKHMYSILTAMTDPCGSEFHGLIRCGGVKGHALHLELDSLLGGSSWLCCAPSVCCVASSVCELWPIESLRVLCSGWESWWVCSFLTLVNCAYLLGAGQWRKLWTRPYLVPSHGLYRHTPF